MSNVTGKVGLNLGGNNNRGAAQLLQIIQIPNNLPQSARALRLEGQVTQVNTQQNSVQIQTAEGEVEVRANTQNVRAGDRVTVEVPAGRPPRGVRVIVEPPPQQSQPQNNSGQQANNSRGDNRPAPSNFLTPPTISNNRASPSPQQGVRPEGQSTPQNQAVARAENALQAARSAPITENLPRTIAKLTTAVTEEIAAQISKILKQAPQAVRPETIVRLLSTTPQQAQNIITQTLQSLPPVQAVQLQNTINNLLPTITQNNPNIVINNTVPAPAPNITGVVIPNTPQVNFTNIIPAPAIISLISTPQNAVSNLAPILPNTQIITTNQQLPPQQINNALQQIIGTTTQVQTAQPAASQTVNQTVSLQPVVFDPAAPQIPQVINAPKLEVQILSVNPPAPAVTNAAPQTSNVNTVLQQPVLPPITNAANAITIPAQVAGFTPRGLPLISIQLPGSATPQFFIGQIKGENLQLGSQLQILQRGSLPVAPAATQVIQTSPLLRGFQWPALDELNLLLQQMNPQAAASLTRSLPSASNPTQLTAAAMSFIAAVKSGDLASLLGNQKIDLIRQAGRDNILNRLTLGDGARAGAEPVASGDWRAVPLPMFWEGEIHRITLYTRQENFNQENDPDENQGHTRFIFDLSLSNMGDVQLDGFLKDQRLDLVLRTQQSFSEPMQQTMRQAYSGALEQTNLSGDLNFQGSLDNWVKVDEEKASYTTQI